MRHLKLEWIRKVRRVTDEWLIKGPLPKVHPHIISGLSVMTSIVFVLVLRHSIWAFIVGVITLLLDWLDGLVAKKYHWSSEEGYMVDVAADRLSEGIMLVPFIMPWYFLFAGNSLLSIISFVRGKHVILPLRQFFLVYFLFWHVI